MGENVEWLTLVGSAAIAGFGNALDNVLDGSANSGANALNGGLGNDTYVLGAGDTVVEALDEGIDRVVVIATYTLGDNLEELILDGVAACDGTGDALANFLVGNDAANVLDGSTGADEMWGAGGNDTYIVDDTGDSIWEDVGQGVDLVKSSVTFTLSADVENLTLTGTSAINGTGNALANLLSGNSAANVLAGGAGNDTYVVSSGDTVTEGSNAGTDTVQSDVTWTLASNVENLTLTGTGVINGTGNTLANILIGNAAANTLSGWPERTDVGGAGQRHLRRRQHGRRDRRKHGRRHGSRAGQRDLHAVGQRREPDADRHAAINGTGNALDNVLTGNSAAIP